MDTQHKLVRLAELRIILHREREIASQKGHTTALESSSKVQ